MRLFFSIWLGLICLTAHASNPFNPLNLHQFTGDYVVVEKNSDPFCDPSVSYKLTAHKPFGRFAESISLLPIHKVERSWHGKTWKHQNLKRQSKELKNKAWKQSNEGTTVMGPIAREWNEVLYYDYSHILPKLKFYESRTHSLEIIEKTGLILYTFKQNNRLMTKCYFKKI